MPVFATRSTSVVSALFLLSGLGVVGCDGPKDGGKDDTGDSVPEVVYDEGCITVDGAGGYAHIADAIYVADEGSTIALCAGTWEEPVTVDKPVIIVGAGIDETIVSGDGTHAAFNVTAANVTISGLTVVSSYIGVQVSGATAVIDGVKFDATGSWGMIATEASDLTVSNSTFRENVDGALDVEGGTATISGNTFELPTSYAIQLTAAATATVENNVINGVAAEKRNLKDGYGVFVEESTAFLSGNQITDAGSVAVRVTDGQLTASEETWTGGPFGLYMDGGDSTLSDSTLSGQTTGGVFSLGNSSSVTNTTVVTDSTLGCSLSYADWGPAGGDYGCVGVLVAADVGATIENVSTSGFNNGGVVVLPYTVPDGVPTTLSDVVVDDTGRIGIYLSGVDATANNITVSNLREPQLDVPCTSDGSTYNVDYSASMVVAGDLTLTNAAFTDNMGWGISAAGARLQVSDTTFTNNACSAVLNVQSAVELSNVAISGSTTIGLVWDYMGATTISNSSFTGNHARYSYSYDYGDGHIYSGEYGPAGVDVNANTSSGLVVDNCTFSDGDTAINTYLSEVEVSRSTFTGYEENILSAQSNGSTVFSNNTADDFGGSLITAYYGDIEMTDNTVGTTRSYTGYQASYTDGELQYEYEYTSYGSGVVYAYGYTDSPCSLLVDGLSVESSYSTGVYVYDCDTELSDVEMGSVGEGSGYGQAINAYWYNADPLMIIDGFSADTVTGSGVYLYTSGLGSSYIDVSGVNIGTASSSGFFASGMSDITLADSDFGETGSYGVEVLGRSTYDSIASLDNVTVSTGASDGMYFTTMGEAIVTNSYASGHTNGLYLNDSDATITGNAFTANSEYGMSCSATVLLDSCSANDLSGNTLGEHLGCSDDCGTE